MASSGSFSNSIVSGHYKLKVDWSQAQDVSANASTITCKLYLINDWSLGIGSRTAQRALQSLPCLRYRRLSAGLIMNR